MLGSTRRFSWLWLFFSGLVLLALLSRWLFSIAVVIYCSFGGGSWIKDSFCIYDWVADRWLIFDLLWWLLRREAESTTGFYYCYCCCWSSYTLIATADVFCVLPAAMNWWSADCIALYISSLFYRETIYPLSSIDTSSWLGMVDCWASCQSNLDSKGSSASAMA